LGKAGSGLPGIWSTQGDFHGRTAIFSAQRFVLTNRCDFESASANFYFPSAKKIWVEFLREMAVAPPPPPPTGHEQNRNRLGFSGLTY
jgi:hypothetical protein